MDRQNPLVSIITPAYNAERFIADTIESVLSQSYANWEMIIVDDCSTDQTVSIIEEYKHKDKRIRFIQLQKNSGAAIARNEAMEHAKGKFLAFLDSDDQWFPEKLTKQVSFMLEKEIAFSFTQYIRMEEDGTVIQAISKAPESVGYEDLLKHCVIGCLTVMVDREKIGGEKMTDIRTRQDYVYWLQLMKKGFRAYGIPEILAKYRIVHNSISSNKWKAAKRQWYVYRKIEKQNLWNSIYYFYHYAKKGIKNLFKHKVSPRNPT